MKSACKNDTGGEDEWHATGKDASGRAERMETDWKKKMFRKPEKGREPEIAGETEGRAAAARWVEAAQTARGSWQKQRDNAAEGIKLEGSRIDGGVGGEGRQEEEMPKDEVDTLEKGGG